MMKSASLFLLPILAYGAVVPLEPRQAGGLSGFAALAAGADASKMGSMAAMFMSKRKAFKIEQMKPETPVPGAKRVKIIFGPYRLRAANSTAKVGNGVSMDVGGTGYMDMVADDFPKDVTVLEIHSEVQTTDFKRASTDQGIYNHHNVFMDFVKPFDVYGCEAGVKANGQYPLTVLGAGATEDGKIRYFSEDGSVKSGYYLGKDRKIMNMVDVINYNNEEKQVYTSTEMEYLEGRPEGYVQATQQRVDPGICGGPNGASIHPPKGQSKFVVKSEKIVALRDGWIINARGHMHDGGLNIILRINDKEVCNSKAIYGGEGHTTKTEDGKVWETIAESTYCNSTIPVKKGDKIYMQANYDVELHPSREQGGGHGSMGGMMGGGTGDLSKFGGLGKLRFPLDGDAEQMAMMVTHFAIAN